MTKVTDLKTNNIHQIRQCFYNGKVITKNELAKQTKLSLAATTNILKYLLERQEIYLAGEAKSTGGRKSKQYVLNKDYYHLLRIILKKEALGCCFMVNIVDLLGNVKLEKKIIKKKEIVNDILEIITSFLRKDNKIEVLALSIPGVCQDGKIDICDFDELVNIDLFALINERFDLEVIIENDVNIASIGFADHYPKIENIVLMYQPKIKYIGCGILIDRHLCKGATNFAGELSYLPFISHYQQDRMLESDPHGLLLKQLATICCVINPEIVGICSDVFEIFDSSELIKYVPRKHCPKIINIDNLDELIFAGLYHLAIEVLKNKIRGEG